MNIKNILKLIKINESSISLFLGILVILTVLVLTFNYFRDQRNENGLIPTNSTLNSDEAQKKHTVKSGETLWSIALTYFNDWYKWSDIAKANNIKNPQILNVGTELIIPAEEKVEIEPAIKATAQATSEAKIEIAVTASPSGVIDELAAKTTNESVEMKKYTVQKGDNLWKISVKIYGNGYKWSDIAKINNLKNPNIIHAGNVFNLP